MDNVEKLAKITDDFTTKVMADYKKEKGFDARKVFSSKMTLKDMFNIAVNKVRCQLTLASEKASPEKKERAILRYCESVLPTMKKAFGEAFLVCSLPVEAQDADVIAAADRYKAYGVSGLCRKAKARAAQLAPKA